MTAPVLILHFNGTSGSQSFPDSSGTGKVATARGSSALTTANKQLGSAALDCSISGTKGVTIPATSDFSFGTGDFTVHLWVDPGSGTAITISDNSSGISPFVIATAGGNWAFYSSSNGTSYDISGGVVMGAIAVGWQHLAVTRTGGVIYTFVNGVEGATISTAASLQGATSTTYIGTEQSGSVPFTGQIDELVVIKGQALWTANFTPPSTETVVADTGTVTQTLGAITLASTGKLKAKGVSTATLGAVTSAAAGKLKVKGALSTSVGLFVAMGTGDLKIKATEGSTLDSFTIAATGKVKIKGATSTSIGVMTVVATLKLKSIAGVLSVTLGNFTAALVGVVKLKGVVAATLGPVTAAGVGTEKIKGAVNTTIGAVTSSSAAQLKIRGQTAEAFGAFTLSSSAHFKVFGSLTATLGAFILASTGGISIKPRSQVIMSGM